MRLLAARGAIAPRPLEQLALLMLLVADPDAEIRQTAEQTLARIPTDLLGAFIGRSDVPTELREFFVGRGVTPIVAAVADASAPLVDTDDTEYGPEAVDDQDKLSTVQKLAAMTVPQKIGAAMKGTREMRTVLIRDPNKLVALAVLSSPKVNEAEVESYARMATVGEDVLRTIGQTRAWIKNYGITSALVKNAKTPTAIALNLLSRLNETDVRKVSIDRNVSEALRIAARKKLSGGG